MGRANKIKEAVDDLMAQLETYFEKYSGAGWGESFDHDRIRDFDTQNSSPKIDAEFECDTFS